MKKLHRKEKRITYIKRTMLCMLILFSVTAQSAVAQERAYSVRLGNENAKNELVIYFSLGCSHCIMFFEQHAASLQKYIDNGTLKIELVEVQGAINFYGSMATYQKAREATLPVSKTFACLTHVEPERAFEFISIFSKSVKVVLHGSELTWQRWAYAQTEDVNKSANSPFFNAKAKDVQMELAKLFFLEAEVDGTECAGAANQNALDMQVSAQAKRFETLGIKSVPATVFNGKYVPNKKHSLIFKALRDSENQ